VQDQELTPSHVVLSAFIGSLIIVAFLGVLGGSIIVLVSLGALAVNSCSGFSLASLASLAVQLCLIVSHQPST
jgi:hypothetical protein